MLELLLTIAIETSFSVPESAIGLSLIAELAPNDFAAPQEGTISQKLFCSSQMRFPMGLRLESRPLPDAC